MGHLQEKGLENGDNGKGKQGCIEGNNGKNAWKQTCLFKMAPSKTTFGDNIKIMLILMLWFGDKWALAQSSGILV